MESQEEGGLLSFRILEVASGKKKKTSFQWHILEVRDSITFAKAFEALIAIDADGTVAFSYYANSSGGTRGLRGGAQPPQNFDHGLYSGIWARDPMQST